MKTASFKNWDEMKKKLIDLIPINGVKTVRGNSLLNFMKECKAIFIFSILLSYPS